MTSEHGLDSNFRYVVMAARRARQLQNGSQPLIDSRSNKACRVAQEEIIAGKVTAAAQQPPVGEPETVGEVVLNYHPERRIPFRQRHSEKSEHSKNTAPAGSRDVCRRLKPAQMQ